MESQPQNPDFKNHPEYIHPCKCRLHERIQKILPGGADIFVLFCFFSHQRITLRAVQTSPKGLNCFHG